MHYYRYLSWGSFGAKFGKRLAIIIRESNRNKLGDLTRRLQIEDHVVTEILELSAVLDKNLDKVQIDEILRSERKSLWRI